MNRDFLGYLSSQLSGMKETRSLGAEQQSIKVFGEKSDQIQATHLRLTEAMANTTAIHKIGVAILLCGLLYVAREWLHTPIASLVALVVVFSRVLPRLRDIHSSSLNVLHMLPAFTASMDLLVECGRHRDAGIRLESNASITPAPIAVREEIQFTDVCFRYDADAPDWTLRDVSLRIPVGRTTAIVGPSGAGKSTLVDLLLTLVIPDQGRILADGQPLAAEQTAAWRRMIGYVPQETYLFHGSIRDNLLWARFDATEADLTAALESAAALEFVNRLPDSLETVVGERGVRLSGGERQRIALARALLRKPAVLILDEATSALDAENQQRIQQAVADLRGDLTVVTIAHRLSTVHDADQVVVLESGRVVETGSFRELAAQDDSRLKQMIWADGNRAKAA